MHYLKIFEASKPPISKLDPEKISKLLYDYSKEYDQGEYFWDIDDIVRESLPDDVDTEYADALSYDEILSGITNLLNNRKHFQFVRQFDKFLDIYDDIKRLMDNDLSIEEMEDYFLDMKDYNINRSSSGFIVYINSIEPNDVVKTFNRIWTVIGSRIPEEFYIQNVRVALEQNGKVEISVIISKKDKKE